MYQNYMNKPTFMSNTSNPGFGATTSTFGQPAANTSMFPSMQPSNIFQTPSTSSFNTGPTTQNTFGSNLFGQQPQPSTSGLFGSGNAFGQNKTTFGFGSTPSQTGLFGQQPQQQNSTSLFQSSTPNLFGSGAFGSNQTNGTVIKFSPVTGTDTMQKNGVTQSISTKHHCITCMKEYENKSLEELRFEDYSCNRKGPQQQPGFGAAPFGAVTSSTTTSLFGQADNKQAFGQNQGFGQTPAFGQTTPAFGVTNQTNTSTLFGKPNTFGATTSTTPSFGFNAAPPATSNPFSANQAQKPFAAQPLFGTTTTQAQPSFGSVPFGQPNTQNTTANLFKPAVQPTTGFNTAQQGFSFSSQPSTTQSSNLFQVSKPSTGFSIFGQTNTTTPGFGQTTQPAFGTNFGKLTQPTTFTQPSQPAFGTNLNGGLQQSSLFGNTTTKPVFGGGTLPTGGSLFSSNVFQQTPTSFSLNMNQQQATPFPPEPDDSKNISLIATDSFPDGPHVYGLEPLLGETKSSTTNPQDIKAVLDISKKREEFMGARAKIKVQSPKPKRGTNLCRDLFDTVQGFKKSPKCLVIRKFEDNSTDVYSKYNNELLQEAEDCVEKTTDADNNSFSYPRSTTLENGESNERIIDYPKGRRMNLRLNFENCDDDETQTNNSYDDSTNFNSLNIPSSSRTNVTDAKTNHVLGLEHEEEEIVENVTELSPIPTSNDEEHLDNPAGVKLARPEYYMYPALKDLHQYMNEKGECIVQGLTIGRRGYGNVYYPDPINIINMNFDDIVHFRHREVIIYPDDSKKPAIGEGLNRRAQVTLDKIFPREKGTNRYITDVNQIIQTNFVDNLMNITQKHNCKFVDYRPKTGSWVFKVKHFSKYGFTDSDEEECEIGAAKKAAKAAKEAIILKKLEAAADVDDLSVAKELGLSAALTVIKPKSTTTSQFEQEDIDVLSPEESPSVSFDEFEIFRSKQSKTKIRTFEKSGSDDDDEDSLIDQIEIKEQPLTEDHDPLENWHNYLRTRLKDTYLGGKPLLQNLKFDLFSNGTKLAQKPTKKAIVKLPQIRSDVLTEPKLHHLPDLSLLITPEKITTTQRCYTDLAIFKCNTFKVGWNRGLHFYCNESIALNEVIYGINGCTLNVAKSNSYNSMMPNLTDMLETTLEKSEFIFDAKNTPTLRIKNSTEYLESQTKLFSDHVKKHDLKDRQKYLSSVWELCTALWGSNGTKSYARRERVSEWLKKTTNDLSPKLEMPKSGRIDDAEAFKTILGLLSFNKVTEASEFASKHKLSSLSLLISQLSANLKVRHIMANFVQSFVWKQEGIIIDDFKRLYLLLAGIAIEGPINVCTSLDWMRCFGTYLWYIAPAAAPINYALKQYKQAFETGIYAEKPKPYYCDNGLTEEYDLLYHILSLYTTCTYQLCYVLHPETHTADAMDYRMSWFLLQLFLSLQVGLIRDEEKAYMHTTFSTQLESMGLWKWAIFSLLYLENNILKKNLVIRILDRHLSTFAETKAVEKELVTVFKVPLAWIHEVKATKAQIGGHDFDYFHHKVFMGDYRAAKKVFIEKIVPLLFANDNFDQLHKFIRKLDNRERQNEASYQDAVRRCALLFKYLQRTKDSPAHKSRFVHAIMNRVVPKDIQYFQICNVVDRYISGESFNIVQELRRL